MRTLEIQIDKKRITKLAILLFFAIIIGIILSYYLYLDGKFSIKLIIVLVFAIPFSLYFLWFNLKKIINKKPGLIIDGKGIIDNSTFSDLGIIYWSNIKDAKLINYQYSDYLVVYLKNNDAFLNKLNGFQKWVSKNNNKTFGSPFIINKSNLKIDKLELLKIIQNNINS